MLTDERRRAAETLAAESAERRRFLRAALLGSLLALAVDVFLLAGPHRSLTSGSGLLGTFFDVQGHALLNGHLDVPASSVRFEGFLVDGRTYIYFGPVPALLRLPVLAVTHGLDGRLTQLSMLLALVVLLGGGALLHWRVRRLVRPDAPLTGADVGVAFLLQLALGAGTVTLYLVSRSIVYHEVELWGAALAVASIAAAVGVVTRPSLGRIAVAGILAALAVNTRVSVGLGPILALGALSTGFMAQRAAPRLEGRARPVVNFMASFGPSGPYRGSARTLAALLAATLVPLALSAAVNQAKFHQPFGLPIGKQVFSHTDPSRQATLAANGGTIFGAQFVPTQLVQAARPDAVGRLRAFPFIGLPAEPPKVIGDVHFDTVEQSLSAPTSMPLLCLLTLVGLVTLARSPRLRPLFGLLVGTLGGFAITVTIGFVTTRYLADGLPFLLLGALVGLHALLTASGRRKVLVVGGVALLTLAGMVVNGSVGLVTQRLLAPEATPADRARFVQTQDDVDRLLGRRPHGVRAGRELLSSPPGIPGDLFVLGRCAGLYVKDETGDLLPVERTARAGLHRLRVHFPRAPTERPEALLTLGSGSRRVTVVSRARAGSVAVALQVGGRTVASGPRIPARISRPASVVLSFDRLGGAYFAAVAVDGRRELTAAAPYDRHARPVLGADPSNLRLHRFSGSVVAAPGAAPVCESVARRAGLL